MEPGTELDLFGRLRSGLIGMLVLCLIRPSGSSVLVLSNEEAIAASVLNGLLFLILVFNSLNDVGLLCRIVALTVGLELQRRIWEELSLL